MFFFHDIQQIIFQMKTNSLEKGQIQSSGIVVQNELFLSPYLDEHRQISILRAFALSVFILSHFCNEPFSQ